jgi:hypothetical protein
MVTEGYGDYLNQVKDVQRPETSWRLLGDSVSSFPQELSGVLSIVWRCGGYT